MRLLFLGIAPKSGLEAALLAGGYAFQAPRKLGPENFSWNPDIVIFYPQTINRLSDLPTLSQAFPQAWLVLIVEKKWLKSANTRNQLIKVEQKNDVWVKDSWEEIFWFGLQNAIRAKSEKVHSQKAQEEGAGFKEQIDQLKNQSQRTLSQLERDLSLAANLQRSLLPRVYPEIPGVSLAIKYIPAAGSGGDYYDIFEFGDRKRFGLLLADSKTHGMAATLLSVLIKVRLEEMKDRFPDSKSFVEFLNREIHAMQQRDLASLSLLYGIFDRAALSFEFTMAGHLRPLLYRQGELLDLPLAANPDLGLAAQFSFRENSIALKPADLLVFHTDGLFLPLSQAKENPSDKIEQLLRQRKGSPDPIEVQNDLMGSVDRYVSSAALKDDITLIQLAINERTLYLANASII